MKRDELESSELQETHSGSPPWPAMHSIMFAPRDEDDEDADEDEKGDGDDE